MKDADRNTTAREALAVFLKIWLYVALCTFVISVGSGLLGYLGILTPGYFGAVVELVVLVFAFEAFKWLHQSLIVAISLAVVGVIACLGLYEVFLSQSDEGGSLIGLTMAFIEVFSIPISAILTVGYLLVRHIRGRRRSNGT